MLNKRQEDLTKVFDKTWNAKHNNIVQNAKEREKLFMNKMFNNPNRPSVSKPLTPEQRVETLQGNMNNAFSGQKQANLNNIIKKWK